MSSACPYKYLFGVPGVGFHETRILGLALYDILGTIAVAALTWFIWHGPYWKHLVAWFIAGEVLHWLAGTDTAFLKAIYMAPSCLP